MPVAFILHRAAWTSSASRNGYVHWPRSLQSGRGTGIPVITAKGNLWLDARARGLAKAIRAIKDDTETKRLQDEFFERINLR